MTTPAEELTREVIYKASRERYRVLLEKERELTVRMACVQAAMVGEEFTFGPVLCEALNAGEAWAVKEMDALIQSPEKPLRASRITA